MLYIEEKDLPLVFKGIAQHLEFSEKSPRYSDEQSGMIKLAGLLDRVKLDYYPECLDKASFILVGVNKGHFYSNGNKRLALFLATTFLLLNDYKRAKNTKDEYSEKLSSLFPLYKNYEDQPYFSPESYGLYNLSIIIADSEKYGISFEELKDRSQELLKFLFQTYK